MRTLTYTALESDEGRLIKRVIRGTMGLSHRQFAMLKSTSGILLDGVSVHANQIVRCGQVISLTLVESPAHRAVPEAASLCVVFEDEDLLILDKPAPLACQSSPRQPDNTLENRLAHYFRAEAHYTFRPVNRLDKGTSGLMVVAKNAHAQLLMTALLHTDDFIREYLAVVEGCPQPCAGEINLPIAKAAGATVRREVNAAGKPARTLYETVRTVGARSLVRIRLDTGRTHQIRVHMRAIGCPVFGDFLYGTESPSLPGRFALHSASLTIRHPVTGALLRLTAPLPPALLRLLDV